MSLLIKLNWTKHAPCDLSILSTFLSEADPRPATEQFNSTYRFGGWQPFKGFTLNDGDGLKYPGDPILYPIASAKLRDETIHLYRSDWVAVIQSDRSFSVARLD